MVSAKQLPRADSLLLPRLSWASRASRFAGNTTSIAGIIDAYIMRHTQCIIQILWQSYIAKVFNLKLENQEMLLLISDSDWDGLAAAIARRYGLNLKGKVEVTLLELPEQENDVCLRILDRFYTWSPTRGFYSYSSPPSRNKASSLIAARKQA
jgi:hypothetical protein